MIRSVYIAAPYSLKVAGQELRQTLAAGRIHCTSRWLDGLRDTDGEAAQVDLDDVQSADALVLINPPDFAEKGSGGRHVEVGAAIMLGMPVFILGVRSNVFHKLPQCVAVNNVNELTGALLYGPFKPVTPFTSTWMLHQLMSRVHKANAKWWVDLQTGAPLTRNVGELLMLVVSELAEAMEGHRKSLPDDKLKHRDMFTVELADALIRIFDIAGGMRLDVPEAFEEKMQFNAVREDHTAEHRRSEHGKKY